MSRYALVLNDPDIDDRPMYWVTNFNGTDNYTYIKDDATTFASKSAAYAIRKTFKLEDNEVIEV